MSGKTILTKEQFLENSKSLIVDLCPSNRLMVYFYRKKNGDYQVTMVYFDDDYNQIVSCDTPIDYTLDEAYAMYVKIYNLQ